MSVIATQLEARAVSASLGAREVLTGIDLELAAGEVVAVAGPNGAGKSTLLRVISGLLRPSRGTVTVDGAPIETLDARALGRRIAYLPQERIVHWPVTVETVVALGRLPHRGAMAADGPEDRAAIRDAMIAMDVAAFAGRSIAELSGGERARVLMARALAQGATYLVADEPTAGLDPAHALALFDHVRRLAKSGHGIAVALHDLSVAARFADRLVLLAGGRIAAAGTPRDVLTAETIARVYGVSAAIGSLEGVPVVLARDRLT